MRPCRDPSRMLSTLSRSDEFPSVVAEPICRLIYQTSQDPRRLDRRTCRKCPMQIITPDITRLIDVPLGTGEGPCWAPDEKALYFVDIPGQLLYRLDVAVPRLDELDDAERDRQFRPCAGREGGRRSPRWRLHARSRDRGTSLPCPAGARNAGNRLNDGKVAPDGRFWVGSMDDTARKGAVRRALPHQCRWTLRAHGRQAHRLQRPGLRADGRTMFHSDSRQRFINAYDYDLRTGDISNGRP